MSKVERALFIGRVNWSECPYVFVQPFLFWTHLLAIFYAAMPYCPLLFSPLLLFSLVSLSVPNQLPFSFSSPWSSLDFPWWLPASHTFLLDLEFWRTELRCSKLFLLPFLLLKPQLSLLHDSYPRLQSQSASVFISIPPSNIDCCLLILFIPLLFSSLSCVLSFQVRLIVSYQSSFFLLF